MPRTFTPGAHVRVLESCPVERLRGRTGVVVRMSVTGEAVIEPDEFNGSLGRWYVRPEHLERIP